MSATIATRHVSPVPADGSEIKNFVKGVESVTDLNESTQRVIEIPPLTDEQQIALSCPIIDYGEGEPPPLPAKHFTDIRVQAPDGKITSYGCRVGLTVEIWKGPRPKNEDGCLVDVPYWHCSVSIHRLMGNGHSLVPTNFWTDYMRRLAVGVLNKALSGVGTGRKNQKLLKTQKCQHIWVPLSEQEKAHVGNNALAREV